MQSSQVLITKGRSGNKGDRACLIFSPHDPPNKRHPHHYRTSWHLHVPTNTLHLKDCIVIIIIKLLSEMYNPCWNKLHICLLFCSLLNCIGQSAFGHIPYVYKPIGQKHKKMNGLVSNLFLHFWFSFKQRKLGVKRKTR